jgi:hypothetical protein
VASIEARDFDAPDETRAPDMTRVDVVRMGTTTAARLTFEPGWRWSECVKPVVRRGGHVPQVRSGTAPETPEVDIASVSRCRHIACEPTEETVPLRSHRGQRAADASGRSGRARGLRGASAAAWGTAPSTKSTPSSTPRPV